MKVPFTDFSMKVPFTDFSICWGWPGDRLHRCYLLGKGDMDLHIHVGLLRKRVRWIYIGQTAEESPKVLHRIDPKKYSMTQVLAALDGGDSWVEVARAVRSMCACT